MKSSGIYTCTKGITNRKFHCNLLQIINNTIALFNLMWIISFRKVVNQAKAIV